MDEFLINILGTIIGGLLLTLILFSLNEFIFTKHNITGEWKVVITINKTSYQPFSGLKIEYKMHLLQKNYDLIGSGEKLKDIHSDGKETIFLRENRVLISIDGYLERKYFSKSKLYFNISEAGRIRETRTTYFLNINNNNNITGKFISTAGDSSGTVTMIKL